MLRNAGDELPAGRARSGKVLLASLVCTRPAEGAHRRSRAESTHIVHLTKQEQGFVKTAASVSLAVAEQEGHCDLEDSLRYGAGTNRQCRGHVSTPELEHASTSQQRVSMSLLRRRGAAAIDHAVLHQSLGSEGAHTGHARPV